MKDISKYNMVNPKNARTPNCDLSNKKVIIEFWLNHLENLVLIGKIDSEICWFSRTSLHDKETNARIFDYISNQKPEIFSSEYFILSEKDYRNIRNWYKGRIYRTENGMWKTPFVIAYPQKEQNGKRFASDIITFFDKMQKKCRYRYDNGRYVKTLDEYYKKLSGGWGSEYYYKMSELIEIIDDENYLLLAENNDLREAYIRCMEEAHTLYCSMMTETR